MSSKCWVVYLLRCPHSTEDSGYEFVLNGDNPKDLILKYFEYHKEKLSNDKNVKWVIDIRNPSSDLFEMSVYEKGYGDETWYELRAQEVSLFNQWDKRLESLDIED